MPSIAWIAIALATISAASLLGLRWSDARHDESVWRNLVSEAGPSRTIYDPDMVKDLPAPTQRYFNFSISPGTPLVFAVELEMQGELGLGSFSDPKFTPMNAQQVLAPPHGFAWQVRVGAISGADGATSHESWTRFWLFGLIPVVRVSDDVDHHRSALGRLVAESAFWAPAMLLPGEQVRWEAIDEDTARAVVSLGGFDHVLDLTVARSGQLKHVVIERWSNENASREYRLQPFGGYLGDYRRFGGYMLPTSVEGGNHFGTDEYFPFFKAQVTRIRFPGDMR